MTQEERKQAEKRLAYLTLVWQTFTNSLDYKGADETWTRIQAIKRDLYGTTRA